MEDFNVPTAERISLLERLQEAMDGAPPYFWAACHICDLKTLEKLVEFARIYPVHARLIAAGTVKMVLHWSQSSKRSSRTTTSKKLNPLDLGSSPADFPSSNTPPAKKQKISDSPGGKVASSPVLHRNQAAIANAEQRDDYRCVLTGDGILEVAHIYPFSLLKNKEEDIFGMRHSFWDHLKIFWPEEKVAAWTAELFPRGINEMGIERVYNLITLSHTAHSAWNQGAFALKPISVDNDNTTLKVQFFWQKKHNNTQATMNLLETPLSTENLDYNKGAINVDVQLFDFRNKKLIKSGDIFELKTDDAIERPLPSFKLLEMQWFLQRVIGMAGPAIPYEAGWGDEDSEEVSNLGLDEDEDVDSSFVFPDSKLPDSLQFPRNDNLLPIEGSNHHTEETEEDGAEARDGVRVIAQY